MLIKDVINYSTKELLNTYINGKLLYEDEKTARKDVLYLLGVVLKCNESKIICDYNKEIGDSSFTVFERMINERKTGKPVQYITNTACFYGYDFFVNQSCLIPRIDSEVIIENLMKIFQEDLIKKYKNETVINIDILDMCCGSGCLGISAVKEVIKEIRYSLNNSKSKTVNINLTMADKSSSSIQVAKVNTQNLLKQQEINDVCNLNVKFVIADAFVYGFGDEKYDIILCNPPYIETNTIETLDVQVKDFEPKIALDGGLDGLKFYKSLIPKLSGALKKNGLSLIEIGFNQGESVIDICSQNNITAKLIKDYGKNDRVLVYRKI